MFILYPCKYGHTKPIFSFLSTLVYGKHAGGRHIRTSGQEIATMDKWLDSYKVMTSMNMVMQQAVYKSTIVPINSTSQKRHAGGGPETKD